MVNSLFIISLLVFISILLRSLILYANRSYFKQGFVGDSSVHYAIIRQLKINKNSKQIEQYVIKNGAISYPLLFHRFAALFPINIIQKYSYLPNLVIFATFTSFYFVYIAYISYQVILVNSVSILFLSALFYFGNVSSLVFYGPAIAYIKLSERLLGRLTTSFYFFTLYIWITWGDEISFYLSIIFGALAITSSKFARQSIVFTGVLVSLLIFNKYMLINIIAVYLLGFVFSKEHLINGLKYQIKHLYAYYWKIRGGNIVQNALSNFISLKYLIASTKNKKKIVRHLLSREPSRFFLHFPEIILLYYLYGFSAQISVIVIPTLIIFLLTTFKRLNFLGESYRYIEYNLYMLVPFLLAYKILQFDGILPIHLRYILFGYVIYLLLYYIFHRWLDKKTIIPKDKLTKFLNTIDLSYSSVIYPISFRLGADICAKSNYKSFWWQPGNVDTNILEEYFEEYPFLKKDWQKVFYKHNVTHVMADKSSLLSIDWKYDFTDLKIIEEDENYILYKVTN